MASKSTGSASAAAVTVPDGSSGGLGGKENRHQHFLDRAETTGTLNSEMKAKWSYCRGKMGAETRGKAVTSDL